MASFKDSLEHCQSNARSLRILIQLCKQPEDFGEIFGVHTDPVILNKENNFFAIVSEAYLYSRLRLGSHILYGILYKILENSK